jgi:hypothetical protein
MKDKVAGDSSSNHNEHSKEWQRRKESVKPSSFPAGIAQGETGIQPMVDTNSVVGTGAAAVGAFAVGALPVDALAIG